ncbi:hypothetical protein RUM44_001374 [Polyplax serrata]|uniref:Uncharacterized protein n=1 Tax=Polyplax serrata TaxID=468196 RepID=A0ABR1AJV3_POLSC
MDGARTRAGHGAHSRGALPAGRAGARHARGARAYAPSWAARPGKEPADDDAI